MVAKEASGSKILEGSSTGWGWWLLGSTDEQGLERLETRSIGVLGTSPLWHLEGWCWTLKSNPPECSVKSSEEVFRLSKRVLNGVYILWTRQIDRYLLAGICLQSKMSLIWGLKIGLVFTPKNFHTSSTFTPLLKMDRRRRRPFDKNFEKKTKGGRFWLRRCQIPEGAHPPLLPN